MAERGRPCKGSDRLRTDRYDPVTYLAVPTLLAAAALAAIFIPAHRAARADPMQVVRET